MSENNKNNNTYKDLKYDPNNILRLILAVLWSACLLLNVTTIMSDIRVSPGAFIILNLMCCLYAWGRYVEGIQNAPIFRIDIEKIEDEEKPSESEESDIDDNKKE